ncbi:MAG: hypothetical protein IJR72_03415 [Oscillospiraceae bacterium]|nr:hypothetical protein [Oscillospiraceae bacterium]
MQEVQAMILNLSFPKSLEEVLDIQDDSGAFDIDILLSDCLKSKIGKPYTTTWTVRKWCKKGDIVFFMHSKSSGVTISRLKNQLNQSSADYTEDDFNTLTTALERGSQLYKEYGGKIFALGQISGTPKYDNVQEERIIMNPGFRTKKWLLLSWIAGRIEPERSQLYEEKRIHAR